MCHAHGHAKTAPRGADTVCAAVSILVRTTALALGEKHAVVHAPAPGEFVLTVYSSAAANTARLCFAGDFLYSGFLSLAQEFPHAVSVQTRVAARQPARETDG